mgnify:CR=1 FL=1
MSSKTSKRAFSDLDLSDATNWLEALRSSATTAVGVSLGGCCRCGSSPPAVELLRRAHLLSTGFDHQGVWTEDQPGA